MKDNIDVLQKEVLVLLPEPDDRGRAIIYFNPSLKRGDDDTANKVFNFALFCWLLICNFLKDLMYSPPFFKSYRLLNCGGV